MLTAYQQRLHSWNVLTLEYISTKHPWYPHFNPIFGLLLKEKDARWGSWLVFVAHCGQKWLFHPSFPAFKIFLSEEKKAWRFACLSLAVASLGQRWKWVIVTRAAAPLLCTTHTKKPNWKLAFWVLSHYTVGFLDLKIRRVTIAVHTTHNFLRPIEVKSFGELRSSVNIFVSLSCLNSRENWTMWGPKQKWDTRDLIKKRDFQNLHYVNCRSTFKKTGSPPKRLKKLV